MAINEGVRIASCLCARLYNGWALSDIDGSKVTLEKEGFQIVFDKVDDAKYFMLGLEAAYRDTGVVS